MKAKERYQLITLKLPKETRAILERKAAQHHNGNASAFLREAIQNYCADETRQLPTQAKPRIYR